MNYIPFTQSSHYEASTSRARHSTGNFVPYPKPSMCYNTINTHPTDSHRRILMHSFSQIYLPRLQSYQNELLTAPGNPDQYR